jgi:hypothetical protein
VCEDSIHNCFAVGGSENSFINVVDSPESMKLLAELASHGVERCCHRLKLISTPNIHTAVKMLCADLTGPRLQLFQGKKGPADLNGTGQRHDPQG